MRSLGSGSRRLAHEMRSLGAGSRRLANEMRSLGSGLRRPAHETQSFGAQIRLNRAIIEIKRLANKEHNDNINSRGILTAQEEHAACIEEPAAFQKGFHVPY